MSNVQRFRSGNQEVVTGKTQAGVNNNIGDLVALSNGYVVNATTISSSGALGTAVSQEAFHDVFLGVLIEGATTGDETTDTDCVVATTGDYEYDIEPLGSALVAGQLIGAYDSGEFLAAQEVATAPTPAAAIGKLSRPALVGDVTVTVRITSTVMDGGLQTFA